MEQQPQGHHWQLHGGAGQSSGTGATASKSLLWGTGQFVETAALYNDPGALELAPRARPGFRKHPKTKPRTQPRTCLGFPVSLHCHHLEPVATF